MNLQVFTIGQARVESEKTRAAYNLAAMLEQLPASTRATNLSCAAWRLLEEIGKYEREIEATGAIAAQ